MTDQQLQQELILAEHPAPKGVWETVLAVLEEDADDVAIQTELNSSALTPPSLVWNAIEQELEEAKHDEQISTSLNQNTIAPPALLWNSIEDLLNADDDQELAQTLQKAERTAPANAWTVIENELHPQAKVIPITKKFASIYKMAAAAIIIGFISFGVFQLLPKRSTQVAVTETKPVQENTPLTADTNTKSIEPVVAVTEPQLTTPAQAAILVANKKPKRAKEFFAADEVMQHDKPTTKKTKFTETNYLLVLNENGELIRVSKKLSSMDCAKNNDVPVDAVTALQAKDCDAQIKKLQQRMATSVMGSIVDPVTLTNSTDK